jgi:NAD(P)-dependent dehydrogenase (short-subunit alcohol dehydrogenase family)
VETTDIAIARAVLETNFWGSVRTIRAALPAMRAKGDGVIINVTSVSGHVPGTGYDGWYGASKWALNTLSEALVMELQGFGVRVACIEPGFFTTESMNNIKRREPHAGDPYENDYAWVTRYYERSIAGAGGDPVRGCRRHRSRRIRPHDALAQPSRRRR